MSSEWKMRAVDNNPCLEESKASSQCLDGNNYQREMCAVYFNKYQRCRKFWHAIMMKRRADGVSPAMPTVEERRQILASLQLPPY